MAYSDEEDCSGGEIFSEDEVHDLFNDEADEDIDDKKSVEEEVENKQEESKEKKIPEKKKSQRVVKNPRVTLNFDSLSGKNGLSTLKKLFQDFKFKGNGHEKEDLTRIMTILQQWMSYQLCPSYSFESCMLQLENLGKKKVVQTLMKKYRCGIDDWGEKPPDVKENEVDDNEEDLEKNDFDKLLDEEIAKARSDGEFSEEEMVQTVDEIKASKEVEEVTLTPEQLERIARNRKLAEERRLKRMSQQCSSKDVNQLSQQTETQTILEANLLEES